MFRINKRNFIVFICLLISFLLLVTACRQNPKEEEEQKPTQPTTAAETQPTQPTQVVQTLTPKNLTHASDMDNGYMTRSKKGDTYAVFYPQTNNKKIDQRINKDVLYFENLCKETSSDFMGVDYIATVSGENMLSLVYTITGYKTGGDTDTKDIFTRVFRLNTGKELMADKVFKPDFYSFVSEKTREHFKKLQLKKGFSTEDKSFLTATNPEPMHYDRFSFDRTGCVVHFDSKTLFKKPGEVFTLPLDFNQIQDYLLIDKDGFTRPLPGAMPLDVKDDGSIDRSKPMIALTFDDGPSASYTEKILDLLQKHNAKATFFVCGNNSRANPDLLKKQVQAGCQIGNHTMYHEQLTKQSPEKMKRDIEDLNDIIEKATGKRPNLIRPPYGDINSKVRSVLDDYAFIMWSMDTMDWDSLDAEKVAKEILGNISDGEIVLMHDIHGSTAAAMDKVIPKLIKMGYQLVTVDELFYYKGESKMGGTAYDSL